MLADASQTRQAQAMIVVRYKGRSVHIINITVHFMYKMYGCVSLLHKIATCSGAQGSK